MIRETTGMSTTTYCIPEGRLLSFIRDGDRFDAHLDHIGSVRMVTDDNGDVVSRFEFGAFGEQLASSFDGVPGGMPYSWIGGLGVRYDADCGLYYMRQRWYDPSLQRFMSRDPIGLEGGANAYSYVSNAPVNLVDPMGLKNDTPQGGSYIGGGIWSDGPHSYHNYGDGYGNRYPVPKVKIPPWDPYKPHHPEISYDGWPDGSSIKPPPCDDKKTKKREKKKSKPIKWLPPDWWYIDWRWPKPVILPEHWESDGAEKTKIVPFSLMNPFSRTWGIINGVLPVSGAALPAVIDGARKAGDQLIRTAYPPQPLNDLVPPAEGDGRPA